MIDVTEANKLSLFTRMNLPGQEPDGPNVVTFGPEDKPSCHYFHLGSALVSQSLA